MRMPRKYAPIIVCAMGFICSDARAETPIPERVNFERHVMGLLSRSGCNSGSCHGSFQGRGGFRLSLFGYDAEKDYVALTRDASGRRISTTDPASSLVLLKATGRMEHGGGKRFGIESWQYEMLRTWLVQGAERHRDEGKVARVRVEPAEAMMHGINQTRKLTVVAEFGPDQTEDITHLCEYRSNDDSVAEVNAAGTITSARPGDTNIVVGYRGQIATVRVLVPAVPRADASYPETPSANYIDREVFAKLKRLHIVPSDRASDEVFLRRVTIDTIGCLPSPDEVRLFCADTDPQKHSRKIEALLNHPMHAALWATKFCDITGNNTEALEVPRETQARRSQMWHDWFRKRLTANQPYDQIVRDVLCATTRDSMQPDKWMASAKKQDERITKGFDPTYQEKPTLDLFWRRQGNVPVEQWGEKTAAAFLGVRLECAQCHKHPFDRWTQADYRAYANVFAKVQFGISPEAKKVIDEENNARKQQAMAAKKNNNQIITVREVFVGNRRAFLTDPDTNRVLPARPLGAEELNLDGEKDPRDVLFRWMKSPENPYFARSMVNRIWGHYFGIGIVEPVDNFSLANPPTHEALLDELARDFIDHGYDLRHIERRILNTHVYQLSSQSNETNKFDRKNYSHSYLRAPMAEVVLDMLNSALDVVEDWGPDAPPRSRAVEVGASRVQNQNLAYAFRIFGRPNRSSACDCDRSLDPALPQTLYRMTDTSVLDKLRRGRLAQLLRTVSDDNQLLEELFLASLSRLPTPEEKSFFHDYLARKRDRRAAFTDTLWALLNTREFILNH